MAHPILIPNTGMYTVEATLIAWRCPTGTTVALGEPIADIETEKATFEIEAPAVGILHQVVGVGTTVGLETVIAYLLAPGEAPPDAAKRAAAGVANSAPAPRSPEQRVGSAAATRSKPQASPIARRLATEHRVDLAALVGSGPGGRIVEADVLAAVKKPGAAASVDRDERKIRQHVPLTGIRGAIAARLKQGLAEAVPVTLTREIRADVLRAEHERLAQSLGDLSYDALFIKTLGVALRDSVELNCAIVDDHILVFDEVNVGFAAAVPNGLVVPVIRNADTEPLSRIATLVRKLQQRARDGTLRPSDSNGGTATISNLGASGIDAFTPLLNPPQSVILGIGRIAQRAVIDNNRVVPAWACVLSLTFDHRVTDGLPAGRLLHKVGQLLNDRQFLGGLGR